MAGPQNNFKMRHLALELFTIGEKLVYVSKLVHDKNVLISLDFLVIFVQISCCFCTNFYAPISPCCESKWVRPSFFVKQLHHFLGIPASLQERLNGSSWVIRLNPLLDGLPDNR